MEKENQLVPMILIVEDHVPTLRVVQQMVSAAFPACIVLGAESGESALEKCGAGPPLVVVMDISLPGIDGVEATRRIKVLLPEARVVMHSSNDLLVFRAAATLAGAAAFVAKSVTSRDLVPAIAVQLECIATPDRVVKGS